MIVKVTVCGMLDLEEADIKLLKKASPGEVMDTMRYQAKEMKARVEKVKAVEVEEHPTSFYTV